MIVNAAWPESSDTSSDEVSINVLSGIDLSPVVASLSIKRPNSIKLSRWGTIRYETGHLHGLVCGGNCQSLHRVCLRGFTRRHVEEARVEETRIVYKASVRRMSFVSAFAGWIAVILCIKSISWYLLIVSILAKDQ